MRIMTAIASAVDLERLRDAETQKSYDDDLLSPKGAKDTWKAAQENPFQAVTVNLKDALGAWGELRASERFIRHLLAIPDDRFGSVYSYARQLHWASMYACRELHRALINKLLKRVDIGLNHETVQVQAKRFIRETDPLLTDRNWGTHQRSHHDPIVKQYQKRVLLLALTSLERPEISFDAEIEGWSEDRLEIDAIFAAEIAKERNAMLSKCTALMEFLEPIFVAIYRAVAELRDEERQSDRMDGAG